MTAWNELVKQALLGTERTQLDTKILPQNIQTLLEKADKTDKEAFFLKAAALTLTYRKAGQLPSQTPLLETGAAPKETLPFAPPQYMSLLKRLLDKGNNHFIALHKLLLGKMRQQGLVIPYESVCDVLKLLENTQFKSLAPVINAVVGERGRWLQQFNPLWQYNTTDSFDTIWAEGKTAERREALSELRQTQPQKAFELIKSIWENENARDRKEWLKIIAQNIQPDEWSFVQDIYNALSEPTATAKAINQEMREMAAHILIQCPDSDLFLSLVNRLKPYVSNKKTLLGLKSKTVFNIPQEEDAFFNKETMKTALELTDTPSTNELLTEYWFRYLLQHLHPQAWEKVFETDNWIDILGFLEETDKAITSKKSLQRYSFTQYLSLGIAKVQYRKAALSYIENHEVSLFNAEILNVLSLEELESFFLKHIHSDRIDSPFSILLKEGWKWSENLSQHILTYLMKPSNVYQNTQLARNAAIHFHEAILTTLYQAAQQEASNWEQQNLKNNIVQPLIEFLELKKEILELKLSD